MLLHRRARRRFRIEYTPRGYNKAQLSLFHQCLGTSKMAVFRHEPAIPGAVDRPHVWQYLRMDADARVCGREPDSQFVELAVEVFAMLADATRVRLILALRDGELSVNHLADIVDKTPAAVSQHLAKLRLGRIVAARQEGQRVFYRLENEHASQLVTDAIFQAEHSLSRTPRHHHEQSDEES
jgi:DNA-binding transcriptional ArsR family regulator